MAVVPTRGGAQRREREAGHTFFERRKSYLACSRTYIFSFYRSTLINYVLRYTLGLSQLHSYNYWGIVPGYVTKGKKNRRYNRNERQRKFSEVRLMLQTTGQEPFLRLKDD